MAFATLKEAEAVAGKTELDAVVAYLQGLGRHAPTAAAATAAGQGAAP